MIDDFVKVGNVEPEVIKKYEGVLPKVLLDIWREYGYGSFLDGFVKVINPDDYMEVLKISFPMAEKSTPMLATGFGDLIVSIDRKLAYKFDYLLQYRYQTCELITVEGMTISQICKKDPELLNDAFEWPMYQKALKKYGPLAYDECFFYAPMLPMGGSKRVENLHKGKIRENIELHAVLCGGITSLK